MITQERLDRYKKQALASVTSRANNPAAPGIACVNVSPHDLLDLILAYTPPNDDNKQEDAQ